MNGCIPRVRENSGRRPAYSNGRSVENKRARSRAARKSHVIVCVTSVPLLLSAYRVLSPFLSFILIIFYRFLLTTSSSTTRARRSLTFVFRLRPFLRALSRFIRSGTLHPLLLKWLKSYYRILSSAYLCHDLNSPRFL